MKRIGLLVIIIFAVGRLFAFASIVPAIRDTVPMDSVRKIKQKIQIREHIERDTLLLMTFPYSVNHREKIPLVYLPDSLIRDTLRYEYTKIKNFAYKNRWTKELYKMVFVNPRPGYLSVMRTQNSEERFNEYRGKIIGNISIKVLPPYGSSVYDTTYIEDDMEWMKNMANRIHIRTAEKSIRRQLTFKSGMRLLPFELVQNEMMLRQLDYLDDANILVSEVPGDTNRVNILLICKDQFSWGATVESNFLNSVQLGFENKNFMKLGHILNYEFSYRGTKEKKWGNILEYKVNSLGGTHINVRGYYKNDYKEKQVRVEIDRQFVTSQMQWAGGVSAGRVFYSDDLPDRNMTRLRELFNYHFQDIWLGKSFQLPFRYSYNRNIYLTSRFFTTYFNHRPIVTGDTNHLYYNRLDYFTALTYTKIKYYKANLIYDFGRTEDIPTGLFIALTGGFEKSEFDNYGYVATEFRYSHFNKLTERWFGIRGGISSYVGENGFEQGLIKLGGSHISNLCSLGNLKFRFYNDINYVRGIRRYPADYLYMEDANIRGFSSDTLRGNQKLSISLGTTFFLPYIKKGFRTSIMTFVDAGIVAPENIPLSKNKTYWGFGVALNIRNDNVVLKNLSIRLSFYPTIPADGRSFQAIVTGRNRNGFYDYRVTKPQVIQYQ
ncbi:MAG: hypothetical protein RR397_01390 [Odoribacter sp.]